MKRKSYIGKLHPNLRYNYTKKWGHYSFKKSEQQQFPISLYDAIHGEKLRELYIHRRRFSANSFGKG